MPNYLYLLVRTDMTSLGRGKSVAQGAHGANAFTWDTIIGPSIAGEAIYVPAIEWSREANGFGTTIALAATLSQIEAKVTIAKALGYPARVVADPEYPLVDGKTLHLIPDVVTCGYIFGDKTEMSMFLSDLQLLPNDPV